MNHDFQSSCGPCRLILNPPEQREMTDRLVPAGFQGNYWGPEATRARREGKMPPVQITPQMATVGPVGPAGPPRRRHRVPAGRCPRAPRVLPDEPVLRQLQQQQVLAHGHRGDRGGWAGGLRHDRNRRGSPAVLRLGSGQRGQHRRQAAPPRAPQAAVPKILAYVARSSWNSLPSITSSASTTRRSTAWR